MLVTFFGQCYDGVFLWDLPQFHQLFILFYLYWVQHCINRSRFKGLRNCYCKYNASLQDSLLESFLDTSGFATTSFRFWFATGRSRICYQIFQDLQVDYSGISFGAFRTCYQILQDSYPKTSGFPERTS